GGCGRNRGARGSISPVADAHARRYSREVRLPPDCQPHAGGPGLQPAAALVPGHRCPNRCPLDGDITSVYAFVQQYKYGSGSSILGCTPVVTDVHWYAVRCPCRG